ncbi:hypothetical protein [Parasphingorhabdus cellanae]|uniref:Uncharacterized protein n=1 Tax=Parasphingorhabdus cellanae TaxID=2806553 RepID=A0ABX7T7C8_9SPHN|nr:hypothetical protein [Parasphingorhabdus cellanae]QTD57026.1 hypothetical protein J4G78_05535 [Parasphingorhabdus cellanae]
MNNDEQMRADNIVASARSGRANAADFDTAELRAGPTLGQGLYLIVSGPAPKQGANIRLLPVLGDTLPEYQQIEIAWEARAANDHDVQVDMTRSGGAERYEKSMPLSGLSGTKGIELVGANGTKKFNLTGQ